MKTAYRNQFDEDKLFFNPFSNNKSYSSKLKDFAEDNFRFDKNAAKLS